MRGEGGLRVQGLGGGWAWEVPFGGCDWGIVRVLFGLCKRGDFQAGGRCVFSGALAHPLKNTWDFETRPCGNVRRSLLRVKRFLTGASRNFSQSAGTRKHCGSVGI